MQRQWEWAVEDASPYGSVSGTIFLRKGSGRNAESKLSENLGSFKIPVEVIPYGSQQVFKKFEAAGYAPTWRLNEENERLITDMHHFIIDLHIAKIENPQKLADELDLMVGVVEHGLFNDMVKKVIVAGSDGVKIISQ